MWVNHGYNNFVNQLETSSVFVPSVSGGKANKENMLFRDAIELFV